LILSSDNLVFQSLLFKFNLYRYVEALVTVPPTIPAIEAFAQMVDQGVERAGAAAAAQVTLYNSV
jgi:hypothetical protein